MQLIRPNERSQSASARSLGKRGIAIERDLARYITLCCGHYTTREAQEVFDLWRPHKGLYYCETCYIWSEVKRDPKPAPLPNEPLF